jgi:hypothetical protein
MTGESLKAPREYASWLPLLDRFREGDDSALTVMEQGSIDWTNVVAERWTQQVSSAVTTRLTAISKLLQVGLDRARGDAFAISRALLDTRRALQPLRLFVALPCLPENVKNHLQSEVERWAKETQEVLEKNAKEIRTDNGRLLKIIRDSSLTVQIDSRLQPVEKSVAANASAPVDDEPLRHGRRVIL